MDFITEELGDNSIKNEVHIKRDYRTVTLGSESMGADSRFAIYYPHVKGTECKIYDKNMKLLLTIENSACTFPINDPYLNEQTIVIEN